MHRNLRNAMVHLFEMVALVIVATAVIAFAPTWVDAWTALAGLTGLAGLGHAAIDDLSRYKQGQLLHQMQSNEL